MKSAHALPCDTVYGFDDFQIAEAMAEGYELGLKEGGRADPREIDDLRGRLHAALLEVDREKKLRPMYREIGFDQGALAMRETVAAVLAELGEDDYAAIVREMPIGAVTPEDERQRHGRRGKPGAGASNGGRG